MIRKEDCIPLKTVIQELGKSKPTVYNYLNFLGIQRHKFPFDNQTYVLKRDLQKVKDFIAENQQQ